MTKSLLFSSSVQGQAELRTPNRLSKIKIKQLHAICEDTYFFSFAAIHDDQFILGKFRLEDKWLSEKNRYVNLQEVAYWQLDIVDIVTKFDIAHLASDDFGKKIDPEVEIFDFIPYQIGKHLQIKVLYRAHYPGSKLDRSSRISIQHIAVKSFRKSNKKSISLKFATTLQELPVDAQKITASIRDYSNKFVYTIEWENKNKDQFSSILRTTIDVFNYIRYDIEGPILGIGAREVDYGIGFKIFVASNNGFYEEISTPNVFAQGDDLVLESHSVTSVRNSNNFGQEREEKMTIQQQEDFISGQFRNFFKNPQDMGIALEIKRERGKFNQETVQPYLVSQTYKIVEEISRNLVQATKSQNEDLTAVSEIRKRDARF